jgi:hypothetical protein
MFDNSCLPEQVTDFKIEDWIPAENGNSQRTDDRALAPSKLTPCSNPANYFLYKPYCAVL